MRLAFDKRRRIFGTKVKSMIFFPTTDADRNNKILCGNDSLPRKTVFRETFKIASSMSIAR